MINSIARQLEQATQTLHHVRNIVESGYETAKEASRDQYSEILLKLHQLVPILWQFYHDQPFVAVFCGWMAVLTFVPMVLVGLTSVGLMAGWLLLGSLITIGSLFISTLFIILPLLAVNVFISLGLTAATLIAVAAYRYLWQGFVIANRQQQSAESGIVSSGKLLQFTSINTDSACSDLLLKEE